MKDDGRFNVFLHSSANLPRIEKHVRRNANLYKSTDWKEANSLLASEYNIYILHKETKDSDTLGKLIRQRHPGALVVLITNEPVVNQDTLDKYHADYSLFEDPTRAELLSTIPSFKKLREVEGGQDTGHVADVIHIHTEPSAVILEDRRGSAVDIEQEALATEEIELVHEQPLEYAAATETKSRRSIATAVAAFFARLTRQPQSTKVEKETGCGDLEDKGAAPAVSGSRSRLITWISLALVILLMVGLGIFARGSNKVKKKASVHRVTNASQPSNSAPAVATSQPSEQALATPVDSFPTAMSGDNSASSKQPAPVPEPTPSPAPIDNPSSESGETAAPPQQQPAVNHPPTVGISGPTQLTVRQTATYTASGSDPDGDGITYSWGGSTTTRCWSTPGLYTVSVTVTDSRGESAGASVSVRVI